MLNATHQRQNPTGLYYYRFMYLTKIHDKVCTDEHTVHFITLLQLII